MRSPKGDCRSPKDAVSRRDFRNRVGTSRKESKEARFFLRMIAEAVEPLVGEARVVARSAGAQPHLRRHLEEMRMNSFPVSPFALRPSTFVLRHSSILPSPA